MAYPKLRGCKLQLLRLNSSGIVILLLESHPGLLSMTDCAPSLNRICLGLYQHARRCQQDAAALGLRYDSNLPGISTVYLAGQSVKLCLEKCHKSLEAGN